MIFYILIKVKKRGGGALVACIYVWEHRVSLNYIIA